MKTKLQINYEKAVQAYIDAFCDKYGTYLEYWVANEIGGICYIRARFFNFHDIKLDIDLNAPENTILDWYDWSIEDKKNKINYKSWLMGLRPEKL